MKIISIEGPDGVGKSTQASKLVKDLELQGKKVYFEHFPRYDTPIGGLIGKILNGEADMPKFEAMQMLYAADQTDFSNKIKELEKQEYDYLVLDRYFLSTIVYYCTKMNDLALVSTVRKWQEHIIMPDVTVVLLSDISITQKESFKDLDLFEKDLEITTNLNTNYETISKQFMFTKPIGIVNANDTINNVYNNIQEILKMHLF